MNLPNFFLADLPPDALLTPQMVRDACQTLKRNRERYLASRSTQSIIKTVCELGENWLQPHYPLRQLVLKQGPQAAGFSQGTLASGLDDLFSQFTTQNFQALLIQELGHLQRFEGLHASSEEQRAERASTVRGPELLVHFAAGSLPNPPLMSIVLGLLTRSAQFVKCASGQTFLPHMFAHSLYDAEPKLGACLEIAQWPGGTDVLERELFSEADCVTATGNDETLVAIKARLPARVRFLGYGHKVSFSYIAHELLNGITLQKLVNRAAQDVVAWNQLGCLSPHLIYVESGGGASPEQFAELLARELEAKEETQPRGQLTTEESGLIASRRGFYEVRAAHSPETKMWCSSGSTAWTVVFEADPQFQRSCLNRFVYVKAVSDLNQVLQGADAVCGKVSTVGLAAPEDRAQNLANQLARWGVSRICRLGKMQSPPLTWRHDGRPALGDLVTWTDWEM
ncbi:MAG TPA: acyl-CoA reductase [Verrucomicrobiae bacterium]|nr:acyl-CoA reductase [Verrucomicrobiae bacterium]